jgi:hypothetical protein
VSEVELDDDADHGENGDNIAHSAGTAMLREIEIWWWKGEPLEAIEWNTITPRALIT